MLLTTTWNLWHGCHKISEGCKNCYVYREDAPRGRDSSIVRKTKTFYLPVERYRNGAFKVPCRTIVWTCLTSDFFIEDADEWREEAWRMMRLRQDLTFFIITKRIERAQLCFPNDWEKGYYRHVNICCTVENQKQAERRLPVLRQLDIGHKAIICEPLLGPIDLREWLNDNIEQVIVGGESGEDARICDYEWVKQIRDDCVRCDVPFFFKQTGARFRKDGKLYRIPRKYQHEQALKAGINYKSS